MSEKNTKDDDVSKEETGGQKENKILNILKKYTSIAWAELGSIIADIKNASQRVAEEKAAAKEIVAVEVVPNQSKPTATEFFKKQINNFKSFWSYLSKKSKLFIAFALIVVINAFIIDEPYEVKNEDAYCAGMLTRTSGLIEENIRKWPEDSQHIALKFADLLLILGPILVEQALNSERKDTDTDTDAGDMKAGASFAEMHIDKNDMDSISRHGTVIREAVKQCINRVED